MTQDTNEILAQRRRTHGEFFDHAAVTQALMAVLERSPNWEQLPDVVRETLHMDMHKTGRIVTGNPYLHEHWNDKMGYCLLVVQRTIDGVGLRDRGDFPSGPHPSVLPLEAVARMDDAEGLRRVMQSTGVTVHRSAATDGVRSGDLYSEVAAELGCTREEAKKRMLNVCFSGGVLSYQVDLSVFDEGSLGAELVTPERLSSAIEHAVNYHSLDSRLNMADSTVAQLLTPQICAHLRGGTDVQVRADVESLRADGAWTTPDPYGALADRWRCTREEAARVVSGGSWGEPSPEEGSHHARRGGEEPGEILPAPEEFYSKQMAEYADNARKLRAAVDKQFKEYCRRVCEAREQWTRLAPENVAATQTTYRRSSDGAAVPLDELPEDEQVRVTDAATAALVGVGSHSAADSPDEGAAYEEDECRVVRASAPLGELNAERDRLLARLTRRAADADRSRFRGLLRTIAALEDEIAGRDSVCGRSKPQEQQEQQQEQDPLPPSLAATPNIPPERQTLEQLRAEQAHWLRIIGRARGWGAGLGAAHEFLRAVERWIIIRERGEDRLVPRQPPQPLDACGPSAGGSVGKASL